ncbi:MAG TPA: polyphenol oxidase family protein [Gemmatimonadales bacterium]|nr:polyphenol oxidase family protein [Gemmatimonadales bacterium]
MTDFRAVPAVPAALAVPAVLREQPVGDPSVPRVELREWADRYGVIAGITTRGRGFSLGLWSEENVGQVMTRWRALRAAFRPAFPALILSHQVHGTAVAWHRQGGAGGAEGASDAWLIFNGIDGHATGTPGLLVVVTVADCIPVYLTVPHRRAVALLHAGWRGAAAGILERGVELLQRERSAQPMEIVMHCGVGICADCYEVGSEVLSRFETPGTPGRGPGVGPRGHTSGHLDLRAALVSQARRLGLAEITVSPWCSAHDRDRFFSHRASGGRDGRMVAYVGMPLA